MPLPNVQESTSLIGGPNLTRATDEPTSVQRAPLGIGDSPDQLLQTEPEGAPASNKDCCTTLCDWIAEVFESCRKFLAQIPCIGGCFLTQLEVMEREIRAYLEDARSRTEACVERFRRSPITAHMDLDLMAKRVFYRVNRLEIPSSLLRIIRQQFGQEFSLVEGDTMCALHTWIRGLEGHKKGMMDEMWKVAALPMVMEEVLRIRFLLSETEHFNSRIKDLYADAEVMGVDNLYQGIYDGIDQFYAEGEGDAIKQGNMWLYSTIEEQIGRSCDNRAD